MKLFPPYRLDVVNQYLVRQTVSGDQERVHLSPKAYDVLGYLVKQAGLLVTHDELLNAVWPQRCVGSQTVKQHVFNVRRALGDPSKLPRFIETHARRGYRFIASVRDEQSIMNVAATARPTVVPLVGRDAALGELWNCRRRAMRNQRQFVFVTGEPGIGKTTLVDEFLRHAYAEERDLRIARGQCIEGYGGREAYYPILEALAQLCRGPAARALPRPLPGQTPLWLVEPVGGEPAPKLRRICETLETIASESPLLLVLEDVHWVDHSTVDLISALARRRIPNNLMVIATKRTLGLEYSEHPINSLMHELLGHGLCREIRLHPLPATEVARYLSIQTAGPDLPCGFGTLLHRHSDGNPLFMVAALEHMTKRGLIAHDAGSWQLHVPLDKIALEVPDSLIGMIEARVGRLSQQEQRVLEAASITGMVFTPEINAAAADLGLDAFEEICESLSRRHGVVRAIAAEQHPNAAAASRYEFAHAMYREVLYLRQTPSRRASLHRRIGGRLAQLFVNRLEVVALELAYHFEQGRDIARAEKFRYMAAACADSNTANFYATQRLQHALELVSQLPHR